MCVPCAPHPACSLAHNRGSIPLWAFLEAEGCGGLGGEGEWGWRLTCWLPSVPSSWPFASAVISSSDSSSSTTPGRQARTKGAQAGEPKDSQGNSSPVRAPARKAT